jgi:hypothetical protein
MQRRFVKYIIDCFSRVPLTGITSINLCFITHSPFILSDIYRQAILALNRDGTPNYATLQHGSFGANIHDILADSFFMDQGSVGVIAQQTIDHLIADIAATDEKRFDAQQQAKILQTIDIIGEPFLQLKLRDMYLQKVPTQLRIAALRAQLKQLEDDSLNKK